MPPRCAWPSNTDRRTFGSTTSPRPPGSPRAPTTTTSPAASKRSSSRSPRNAVTRVAAALRKRPADEPLEHAVVGALIEQYSDDGEPDRDTLALITSAPALQAEFLDTIAAIERPLAEAIAARTGADRSGRAGARGARRRRIRRSPGRRRALATTRTRHQVLGHAERRPHLDRPRPARSRPVTSADAAFVCDVTRWVDLSDRRSGCRADVRTPGTVQQDSSTSRRRLCVDTVPVSVTRPSGPAVAVMRWCRNRVLRASAAAIAASMSSASRSGSRPAAASHTRPCARRSPSHRRRQPTTPLRSPTTGAVLLSWTERRRPEA